MKYTKISLKIISCILILFFMVSCNKEEVINETNLIENQETGLLLEKILNMGFDESDVEELDDMYIVQGDICFPKVDNSSSGLTLKHAYATEGYGSVSCNGGLVSSENYTIGISANNNIAYSDRVYINGILQEIIQDLNSINCGLNFEIGNDIIVYLSSTGTGDYYSWSFLPSCGEPGDFISIDKVNMDEELGGSGAWRISSNRGKVKALLAHCIGHNIGLLHTDIYTNFPGVTDSEYLSTGYWNNSHVEYIPGTPNNANGETDNNSIMNKFELSTASYSGFSYYDKLALQTLYPKNLEDWITNPIDCDCNNIYDDSRCMYWDWSPMDIEWKPEKSVLGSVKLEVVGKNGFYQLITNSTPNDGHYSWSIYLLPQGNEPFQIIISDANGKVDYSGCFGIEID